MIFVCTPVECVHMFVDQHFDLSIKLQSYGPT